MYLPSAMQADISRGMSRMDPFSERRCCAARTCHTCAQNKICQTAERLDDVSMRRYMQCSSERARQKTILKLSKCARRNTHQESHNGRQAHTLKALHSLAHATHKLRRSCLLDVIELLQQLAEVLPCLCPGALHKPGKLRQVALCGRSRSCPGFAPPASARLAFCFSLGLELRPQLSKRFRTGCSLLLWLCDRRKQTQ